MQKTNVEVYPGPWVERNGRDVGSQGAIRAWRAEGWGAKSKGSEGPMTKQQNNEPQAAVTIVKAAAPQESILLMRRTERPEDPWSGHWSYPGGRRERTDRTLLDTALRELHEECGVTLAAGDLQQEMPLVTARRRKGPYLTVAPFVFHVPHVLPTTVDHDEAVEAVWMPLTWWRDQARHLLRPVPNMPPNCLFPAVDLKDHPVWGFTYRLTTDWLGLLNEGTAAPESGLRAANQVLEFVLASGARLKRDWQQANGTSTDPMIRRTQVSVVEGPINADAVLRRFGGAGSAFPLVNLIEAQQNMVRVLGLAFEEYLIRAE